MSLSIKEFTPYVALPDGKVIEGKEAAEVLNAPEYDGMTEAELRASFASRWSECLSREITKQWFRQRVAQKPQKEFYKWN